jgi:hypothetical protein
VTDFQPSGDAPAEVERPDGDRLAEHRTDPATVNKLTRPHVPPEDKARRPQPVPTALYDYDPAAQAALEVLVREAPGNGDTQDRPHFLRAVGDREVCGQDGEEWPCREYQEMLDRDARERGEAPAEDPDSDRVSLSEVAALIGTDPEALRAALSSTGNPVADDA